MKPFKVVCLGLIPVRVINDRGIPNPMKGDIYNVVEIETIQGHIYYVLKEWYPDKSSWSQNNFRPVQDIGDSVEEHINKLIKEEDFKNISV